MTSLPRQLTTAAALLVLAWALTGCSTPAPGDGWDGTLEPPFAEIVVDVAGREGERIPVQITLVGFDFSRFSLSNLPQPEYLFHNVRLSDGQGREVKSSEKGSHYRVGRIEGDTLIIRYDAQPGGDGRHGRQGLVAEDFAIFDGRLYPTWLGSNKLRSARIRFIAPRGWTVASPFRKAGNWYYLDELGADLTPKILKKSCVGVGRFDHTTKMFGETEARVATYSDWADEHKDTLVDKTFRIVSYFHDDLGFDLHGAYSAVWTPKSGSQRVFGGSYANGTCFENPPEDTPRNWRLLGHRLGHSMNKYRPSGISYAKRVDRWFEEGFASYVELTSTEATGIVKDQAYWNWLYSSYKLGRQKNPAKDLAMADEPDAREMTKEYIHYRKAPLVMKMLEDQMVARSGKNVEQFMRAMWQEHGQFRSPLAVKDELEAFTGSNFDDFWATMIEQSGVVIPVWPEYITATIRENQKRPPAVSVGGDPVSGDYLHYLASSGRFATFAQIRDHLVTEQSVRDRLVELRVRLYPELLRDHIHGLPPEDRRAVAEYEATYIAWLAPDDTGGRGATFEINEGDTDGKSFSELLAIERRYLQQVRRGALRDILVRRDPKSLASGPRFRLGFAVNAAISLEMNWRDPQSSLTIEVGASGETTKIKTPDPRKRPRIWVEVFSADRGNRPGVVTIEVSSGDGSSVTRAFWQRGRVAGVPRTVRNLSREELKKRAKARAARRHK